MLLDMDNGQGGMGGDAPTPTPMPNEGGDAAVGGNDGSQDQQM